MTAERIVTRAEAVSIGKSDSLYDAEQWVVDEEKSGTPLNLHRRLAPEITRQIRCIMADGSERGLFFVSDTQLDVQATRGVRELTAESAELLDRIIALTDILPQGAGVVTVSDDMLNGVKST